MTMNSVVLEYFVMVARLGSISRAALELGVEQSTITRHIARLEADAGVRLFHRSGRGVVLTDAGQVFLGPAQESVHALEQARQTVAQLAVAGPAQLVIAAQPTIAMMMFGGLGHALKQRFPGVKLRMVEALGNPILAWLVEGKIDVALLYVPTQAHVVEFDVFLHEPLYGIAAPNGGLPHADSMSVRELLALPMVLPSTQHGLRALMQSLAQQEAVPLKMAIECDGSTAMTKQLVEAGHGCTILPLAAVQRELAAGTLRAVPIADPRVMRAVGIATARNRATFNGTWEINRIIRQVAQKNLDTHAWPGAMPASDER